MRSDNHASERIESSREGEGKPQTSSKVASESVTDETRAATYEPKFTTFSGLKDQTLPAQGKGGGVSEFVLEDKQDGKEYTASGERHVTRLSFIEGLRAQLDKSRTPEEADQLQSAFSMEYMMRKMKEWAASAMSVLEHKPSQDVQLAHTPAEGDPTDLPMQTQQTFSDPQEFISELKRRHGIPDATLTANNHEVASDATPQSSKEPLPPWAEFITKFAKDVKEAARDETFGQVEEVDSVEKGVIDSCRQLLKRPERKKDKTEIHRSFGSKPVAEQSITPEDGKSRADQAKQVLLGSKFHVNTGLNVVGYDTKGRFGTNETHLALESQDIKGWAIEATLHTHPSSADPSMGPEIFSDVDKSQADKFQADNPTALVRSFLLTPTNHLLVYTPRESRKSPNGEEIGFFLDSGVFVVTNDKFKAAFEKYKRTG